MSSINRYGMRKRKYFGSSPWMRSVKLRRSMYPWSSRPRRIRPTRKFGSSIVRSSYSSNFYDKLHYTSGTFFPSQYTTTLRFAAIDKLTTAGGVEDLVIRGNSPYDPYYDAGGEVAAGWDELAAIYTYYRVSASGIKVTLVNHDADDPVHISIFANPGTADITATGSFAQKGAKTGIVTAEKGSAVVGNFATTKALFGLGSSSDEAWTNTAAVPTKGWHWHCLFKNYSTNALNLEYRLDVFYNVTFFELKTQAQQ